MLDIKNIVKKLQVENLPPETRRELKRYLVQLDRTQKHKQIRTDFLTFVKVPTCANFPKFMASQMLGFA